MTPTVLIITVVFGAHSPAITSVPFSDPYACQIAKEAYENAYSQSFDDGFRFAQSHLLMLCLPMETSSE